MINTGEGAHETVESVTRSFDKLGTAASGASVALDTSEWFDARIVKRLRKTFFRRRRHKRRTTRGWS